MRSGRCVVITGVSLFLLVGCEFLESLKEPRPMNYDYTDQRIDFYIKSLNKDRDPLHVVSAKLPFFAAVYWREAGNHQQNAPVYYTMFQDTVFVEIAYADTEFHHFQGVVRRYIGFQREFGGDTTRLSALDSVGGWKMDILIAPYIVVLENGDTLKRILGGLPENVPDTIRPDGKIEIEMYFDWDGLFSLYQDSVVMMNPEKISYRER